MPSPREKRPLQIVLWGASGFTGRLVAEYLATAPSARGVRWGIAGRDRAKLEKVRAGLAGGGADVPILVGDANDPASLDAIATQTRVICSTVGPYAQHGSELVAACVRAGTDYCDITGEVQWIRRMIDAHHEAAVKSGARIVHTCGYDSIPSDLGTLFVQKEMERRHGKRAVKVSAYFGEAKGGASGGTVASMLNLFDEIARDPSLRRVVGDPYALDPRPRRGGPDRSDQKGPRYAEAIGKWTGPFVMSAINARVVRRTNAVLGYPYGQDFRYEESMSLGGGARGLAAATALSAGFGAGVVALAIPPLRKMISKRLPAPGEGPDAEQRARGYWVTRLVGEAEDGTRILAKISDQADPGYGSTCRMLGEAALSLALDDLPSAGGVLTPASVQGEKLIERLRKAGLSFQIEPLPPASRQ
jgi:short subunit dehydrogenase-like uncharacterized protein